MQNRICRSQQTSVVFDANFSFYDFEPRSSLPRAASREDVYAGGLSNGRVGG